MATEIELKHLTFYAFTDPAHKKAKSSSNLIGKMRQAITVVGVDHLVRKFCVYAWAGKLPTSQYMKKLIDVHERFKPRIFGIEANAMQSLFADIVHDEAKKVSSKVTFMPVYQPTNMDKDARIRTGLEPEINNGRLFLLGTLHELIVELRGFPTAATKDIVDCLETNIRIIPRQPKQVAENTEIEARAHYLRVTNAPPWYIEQEITRMKQSAGMN